MQISLLEEFHTYGFIRRQVHTCAIDMSAGVLWNPVCNYDK